MTPEDALRLTIAGGDKPHAFAPKPKPDSHGDFYCKICAAREPYVAHDKRLRKDGLRGMPLSSELQRLEGELAEALNAQNNLRNEIAIEAESLSIMRTNLRLTTEEVRAARKALTDHRKKLADKRKQQKAERQ